LHLHSYSFSPLSLLTCHFYSGNSTRRSFTLPYLSIEQDVESSIVGTHPLRAVQARPFINPQGQGSLPAALFPSSSHAARNLHLHLRPTSTQPNSTQSCARQHPTPPLPYTYTTHSRNNGRKGESLGRHRDGISPTAPGARPPCSQPGRREACTTTGWPSPGRLRRVRAMSELQRARNITLTTRQSMDLAVFFRHLVQQVHSGHHGLPLPYAPSLQSSTKSSARKLTPTSSHRPHNMAFGLCDSDDPGSRSLHHCP
jgi:hypothetical protein